MVLVVGRGLLAITSKMGYWSRLRAFAIFKFGDSMKKLSKLSGMVTDSKQGKALKAFMSTKYGRTLSGVTTTEIAYEGLMWLIADDEDLVKQGKAISKVSLISTSYMKDTFVKYLGFLLENDVVLEKKLKDWNIKLYILAGKNDKSCRIMVKPFKGEPVVLSSFNVINWINKEKFSKGDLKRLSDVLEYEYFHTSYAKESKGTSKASKAYKDNILISDNLDINKVKATMGYSAILYDLQMISKGKSIDTSMLPTMTDVDKSSMNIISKILDSNYTEKALNRVRVHQISDNGPTDISAISRANKMKDMMYDNISKLDYQESGLNFIHQFMNNFSSKLTLVTYPTKFKSSDFNDDGIRKQDDFKAMILKEDEDLNELGNLLMDKRTKVSSSPGISQKKIQAAKEFVIEKGTNLLKSKGKSTGDGSLDSLMSIMTGGN